MDFNIANQQCFNPLEIGLEKSLNGHRLNYLLKS